MVMGFRSSATQVLDLAQPPSGSASCSSDEDSPVSSCVSIHKVHSQTHLDSLMSCDSPELLEHTWTCVTPVGDQGGFLSLSQRVQVNRRTLQHLQTNQRTHLDDREHIAQQQFEDGAFMKRHCVPLRADHDLLTPDTLSGVRLHPVQVRSEGMASLSRHLSDSSSSKLAVGSTRRRPPAASPSRRLRFEDETETEAEFRYLERQRRRVGHRGTGVLLSKPDLNLYVNGRAGMKGVRPVVDRQQTELMPAGRVDQCDSCGTVLGGEINLNLRLQPRIPEDWGRSLYKPSLNLRTEPIRETYIGSITAGETSGGGGGDRCVMNNQVRKRTNQVERNENQVTPPQATLNTDLPINPYAPNQLTTPTQPSDLIPPISKCPSFLSPPVTSAMMSQIRHNGTKAGKNQNQNQEESHRELRSRAELKERSPCEERGLDLRTKNSSSSLRTSDLTAECQAPPTPDSSSDGQIIQPMTAELHSDDASLPKHFRRNQSSRLSLRHLFSTVRLSRSRTSSLDRLSSRPDSSASDPSESDPDLLCRRKSSGLLKKTLSVQSLSVQGSPFLQLRKSSSVQIFLSEQKKKDRSADYRPAAEQFLHRCLSLEDVGRPSSVRSVGRVLQVCSDGTFLLEVGQLKNRLYGFIISRGRGRPDSGVYVEDMVDSSTEKLYAGLLEVGDEILEVNGEKVACLSLDQVTHLLTQNTTATIRVLRHRRTIPR